MLRAIFRRLVVGNSKNLRARLALDQVNGTAQNESAVDGHRLAPAIRVSAGCVRQAKAKLKQPRLPSLALGEVPRPDVQIGANVGNFVLPYAIYCGRK